MIFVTVGTHEQPFDRLLKYIDKIVGEGLIKEKIIVQKGYTNYKLQNCESYKLLGYDEMKKYIEEARVVITHGGPASFMSPLAIGKTPIVVPRKKQFNEHVNDHQLLFAREVEKRMKNIIVVEDEEKIINAIVEYNSKVEKLRKKNNCNNANFCNRLSEEINDLFEVNKDGLQN